MNKSVFHVHTYRCKHASEEREEEFVNRAIELGAEEIVFTDHCPFPGNPFRMRMAMDELKNYVETLMELKLKYEKYIDIKVGLETEYILMYEKYYRQLKGQNNIELLLLGQHFSLMEDQRYSFECADKEKEHRILADGMMAGMKTGLFSAVAHPDQIFRRRKKWDDEMEDISNQIKECAVENRVPLEMNIDNMSHYPKKRLYWPDFWKKLPEGLSLIYGVDAHSVKTLEKNYNVILKMRE